VVLEGVVDDGPRRKHVKLVDARIDVRGDAHFVARFAKKLAGLVADGRVAAIDDHGLLAGGDDAVLDRGVLVHAAGRRRGGEIELRQHARVVQHRLDVAALDAAGQHDDVGARRGDALQVVAAQLAGGLVLHHTAGAQRRLTRRHRRHLRRQAMHGHAQAAGR